jgi:hypothetical protein
VSSHESPKVGQTRGSTSPIVCRHILVWNFFTALMWGTPSWFCPSILDTPCIYRHCYTALLSVWMRKGWGEEERRNEKKLMLVLSSPLVACSYQITKNTFSSLISNFTWFSTVKSFYNFFDIYSEIIFYSLIFMSGVTATLSKYLI